jgi:glycosyltransferase involved in cell wall biosynthesis
MKKTRKNKSSKTLKDTIFVQIASYRDNQLLPTLRDMLENAKNPENLKICICWQHSKEDEWDNLDEYKDDPRFKILDIDYKQSQGVCWARNQVQQHYNGEKWTLQLDSHHRFIKNWDEELIAMLEGLKNKGHEKPLLTAYIPSFNPENDPAERHPEPWKMNFDRFIPEGAVFFLPGSIDNWRGLTEPIPSRFYSAHFCFAPGSFAVEVQHDPNYYFHGEEISIAVRAFTHGYDLFHPNKVVVWHEYTRKGRTKQWDDDPIWVERNNNCHSRNRKLFEMDGEIKDVDFGKYDFGTARTVEDYEKYSGLNFKKRAIQQYTLDLKLAPNPVIDDPVEYERSFLKIFKHCIDIYYSQLHHDDYDFWVVSFEMKDGTVIHRRDADENEIAHMKQEKDYMKVWREFNTETRPEKWVVWMHSKSAGWVDRYEGYLG